MSKQLDELIANNQASSPAAERLLRSIRVLEDMMAKQREDVPDITEQYKALLKLLKDKYPDELERVQMKLKRKLKQEGVMSTGS